MMKKNLYSLQKFILVILFSLASVLGWGQYSGTGVFTKISSLAELTDGYYVIAYGTTQAMNNTNTASFFANTAVTVSSNTITNPSTSIVWKIATDGSGRTIYNEVSSKYVSYTGSSNAAYAVASITGNSERWTFSYTSSLFNIVNLASSTRYLQYNTVSPRFACYTNSQQNITLYKLNSYTVTFDANGGTGTMANQTASSATNLTANAFSRTGYGFTGWATTAGGTVAYTNGASYPFTANATLYAVWKGNVTYDANGGTGTAPTDSNNYSPSASVNTAANALTKSGYTFAGWCTTADGTGTTYAASATNAFSFSGNITLYAKWTGNVTYDANGGTGATPTDSNNYLAGASVNTAANTLTKSGYTFAGWCTTADGTGTTYAASATNAFSFSGNISLYAKWTPNNNTITFDGNGATGGSTGTQTIATAATANLTSNGYTRTGYTFAGWATTAGGAVSYTDGAPYTMGTSNVTLYAQWNINSYNVIYDGNGNDGGTAPTTQSGNYNTTLTISDKGTLTRSGYTFNGWNTASNGSGTSYAANASYTVPANSITLYAQWQTSGGVNGNIDTDEYGTGNAQNQGNWYMKSDATYLYIGISGANLSEGAVVYLDKDANVPVNSGTGIKIGNNYDGTSFSELPFNADLVVYFKNGYQEYRTVSGSSWGGAVTSGMSYASDGGTSTREIAIPWSAIGGQPAKYNWLGYITSSGGYVYSQVPSSNILPPGNIIGTSANWNYYYTVVSATAPFTNTSYTFTGTTDANNFGPISVYDLTMNSSGRFISRTSGTNGAWNIGNDLVVGAGNIYLGSGANPTNISGNLNMLGGYLDNGNVTSPISITNNITLASGASLKLSGTAGGDLIVGGNWSNSGTFNPSGRAVTFNGSTTQTVTNASGESFDYLINDKSASNLVFANNVSINGSSGNTLQLINAGGLDLNGKTLALNNSGGGIYVNGNRTITSSVSGGKLDINQYKYVANNSGTGSLTLDTNVTVNLNSNGNFDFGKSGSVYITTLKGTLSINSTTSCFVNTNPPIYYTGSLLKYNSGGTSYGRSLEWSATSGAGYPYHVQVSNNTTLDYPNTGSSAFSTALATAGDLTIDSGSSLYMDYGAGAASGALTVNGNINLAGNLSLGDTAGGDLTLKGNWTKTGGNFYPNNRAVFFNGGSAQTITGATTFDYLKIDNSAGLTLNNSVINNFTLDLTSGNITLGTNNLTIESTGSVINASASSFVKTNSSGQLKRTVAASDTIFPVGNTSYNPITFNNSGTADVYGVRVLDGALTTANVNTKTVSRRWVTTEAVAGGSNLSVVAQYNTGEENTNFNAGTTSKIGLYDGSAWTEVLATAAGSNPFTFSSNNNVSPSDLSIGTQYFALGKDDAFNVIKHDVIFDANGGIGTMANQSITWGATANLNANTFTRAGYTFTGWATTPSGTVAYADNAPFTMGSSNVTLYAVWVATNHTITFNSNGGIGTMSNQTTNTSTAITLNTFTRTGYTFAGWATSAGGAVVYTDGQSYDFSADITLYAKWTPNNNTITFDANGGTGTMSNQIIATGATASLSANTFTRAGYTFAGWATTAGGAVVYADGASYTMGTGNVTLYAKWTVNNYNVIFNANGGSGVMSNQSIASGSSAALSTNTFTRTGYTFSGWNTAIDGSGTSYANGATYTMGTNDITLYAQWQVLPCLTETFDGGIPVTWTTGGGTTAVNNSGSDYYLNLNENGEYAQLPTSLNYASVSFNLKGSASSNGWTLYLQYSTDGSTWNNVGGSGTIAGTSIGTSYSLQSVTLPTATSYVRLFLQRTGNSAYIGDVFGYCSTNPTITVTPTAALSLGTTICQGSSGTGNYTVKGTNLTNDIVITPPANIEISTDNSTWVTTPVTLTQTGGNIATTTIYVRSSNALGAGAFSGTITHVSTGATTINKSITGTVIASQTPTATVGASSTSVCNGSSVTLTATPSNVGGGTVAYQWYKNSSIVSGATNSTFTDTVTADSSYYCVITITGGCVTTSTATSNTVTVSAIALPSAPALPTITTSCNQATASAVTSVEGTVYWETSSSGILETTSAATPRVFTTAGTYYLRVKNASGCWSPSTTVTITFPSLSITTNVTDVSATVGTNATFSVTSPDAVSYQWEQSTDGGSSWTPIPSATSSSYVVTSVTLGMSGYKYHVILTGSAPCTTTTSAVGTLTVTTFTSGDYRTIGSGNWVSNNASPAIWQRYDGTNWNTSNSPNYNTTDNVYIMEGHNVTATGAFASGVKLNVKGTFTVSTASTSASIHVYENGVINLDGNLTNTGYFIVDDNATVNLNSRANNIWSGTEQFAGNSNFNILYGYVSELLFANETTISTNAITNAKFGNLTLNPSTFAGGSGNWTGILPTGTYKLTNNDFSIINTSTRNYTLNAGDITVGRNLIVLNDAAAGDVATQSTTGTYSMTVLGDVTKNGTGIFRTNGSGTYTLNIGGNFNINAGTFRNGSANSTSLYSTINLGGNLYVGSSATFSTSNTNVANNNFNFIGNTTQTIDVANASTSAYITFNVGDGTKATYVKLINQDLSLGTYSKFNVLNKATLDFGFNGSNTALNIITNGNGQFFNAQSGSFLKITSNDGITKTASLGNVQVAVDKRTYDAGATYHYIGKANQDSGNGLPANLSNKVIVELDTNALTFQPSGSNTITSAGTLEIRKGIVLDNATGSFKDATSASANLIMSGGRLQLYRTSTMPDLSGDYTLTGGVVEFANTNASAQTIRTASYQNIEVSGSNVGNSSGNITLNSAGTFTIKSGGIFSINSDSIVGDAGAQTVTVENGGTFKTGDADGFSGSNQTSIQPTIENIVLADGSTVEYTRADNQTITEFKPLPDSPTTADYTNANYGYYNLKISGDNGIGTTGATVTAKTLATNRVYVRNDLLISDTKALLSIEANKAINVYNNVTNSGDETNLVVESDGNLIQSKSTSINGNTGKITLKRNANLKRLDYNYWGSPVSGQSFINFSPSTLANRFYYYNEVDNSFAIIPDVNSNFVAGKGYAIRAPNNYTTNPKTFPGTFKGVPNNGDITIILNYTDATKGKNMVANPYPSNIDLRLLHQKNSVSGGTFYFWTNDANSWVSNVVTPNGSYGVYSLNQYAVLNIIGSTPAATKADLSPKYPSAIIKPGQGFIIQATSKGNLTFDNSMRTNSITDGTNPSEFFNRISSGGFKKDNSSMSRYWLSLISEAGAKNTILVGYVNDAKNGYEANYDAEILSDSSDNLYSLIADKKYAIQGRDNANLIKDIVPIGLSAYIPGSYTLKIDHLDGVFNNGQAIYLKDKLENKIVNLISQDYNFTINTGGKQDNRFEIVYQPESALAVENVKDNGLVIYENNNKIFIEANRIFNEVKIVDTSGRLLNTIKSGKKQLVIEKNKLVVGVNVLSIIFANEIINKKIISK